MKIDGGYSNYFGAKVIIYICDAFSGKLVT